MLGAIGLPLILVAILLEFLYLLGQIRRKRSRSREYLPQVGSHGHGRVRVALNRGDGLHVRHPDGAGFEHCRNMRRMRRGVALPIVGRGRQLSSSVEVAKWATVPAIARR